MTSIQGPRWTTGFTASIPSTTPQNKAAPATVSQRAAGGSYFEASTFQRDVQQTPPVTLQPPLPTLQPTQAAANVGVCAPSGTPPAPLMLVNNATDGFANLRSEPSSDGGYDTVLSRMDNGAMLRAELDASGNPITQDGYVKVTWDGGGLSGWVSADFVQQLAPPRAVDAAAIAAASPTVPPPMPLLQSGATGASVTQVQENLVSLGYLDAGQFTSGTYDEATKDAVLRFQAYNGVEPRTGDFGPATRIAMFDALGLPRPLGTLSAVFESFGGDPGAISSGVGDAGGVSYGAYQLSSTQGSAAEFVTWLGANHPDYATRFEDLTPGTAAFDTAWSTLAAEDPTGFYEAQHAYAQSQYYEPAKARIEQELGLDLDRFPRVVQDMVWSTAVQHGVQGAVDVFTTALAGQDVNTLTPEALVNAVYDERGRTDANDNLVNFGGSDPTTQQTVKDRFAAERANALAELGRQCDPPVGS